MVKELLSSSFKNPNTCVLINQLPRGGRRRKRKSSRKISLLMEGDAKGSSTLRCSNEDFQPSLHWKREGGRDILVIPLPGFKKDQLRVQINHLGSLKVSGELLLDKNRWSRFHKDFRIPKDCDADGIHAKFAGKVLYVTLPKKLITRAPTQNEETSFEFRIGGSLVKYNKPLRVVLSVSVAIAVLVALGINAAPRLRSSKEAEH